MGDLSEYRTVAEAAADLGLSKSRVEQFVRDGRLAVAVVVGGMRLVRKKDVAALKRVPRPPGKPKRKG